LRGLRRRSEDSNAGIAQSVCQSIDQRCFRPDHDKANVVLFAKGGDFIMLGRIDQCDLRNVFHSGIAGGYIERSALAIDRLGLRQLPAQGMFTPARPQYQDIHGQRFST